MKPGSAEFAREGEDYSPKFRCCDVSGCPERGEYKAPKSPQQSRDFYWFCLAHVEDYNRNWNYFRDMPQSEIENHHYHAATWDRPTWKYAMAGLNAARLRRRILEGLEHDGFARFGQTHAGGADEKIHIPLKPTPETSALETLGLQAPVTWQDIRAQYKALVKKYHPDLNPDDKTTEEKVKQINLAYTVLKLAHQKYSELEKR